MSGPGPEAPLTVLSGVGPATAAALGEAGVGTLRDLLFLFPRRYRTLRAIERPSDDEVGALVRVRGRVAAARRRWLPGRRSLVTVELACHDATPVMVPFFNQPWLAKAYPEGRTAAFEGVLERQGRRYALRQPRRAAEGDGEVQLHYPELPRVSERRLRAWIDHALEHVDVAALELEPLPRGLEDVPFDLRDALTAMHRPATVGEHEAARRHFALREAVVLFREVERRRRRRQGRRGPAVTVDAALRARIDARIPFPLTADQQRAATALHDLLAGPAPMGALLQGDVGTGKTAVALHAALAMIAGGWQVAFLAPTELLAEQHHAVLTAWLGGTAVRCELLTAGRGSAARRAADRAVATGAAHLVVGTHALLSAGTTFDRLGLVVIDEHHRFGVDQRMRLVAKGTDPHVLVMTATPIPRTLTLTLFGDLDVVTLTERPPGRRPVPAFHLPPRQWRRLVGVMERHVARGERVFVVCPRIGAEGEKGGAVRLHGELSRRFRAGLVHGRMTTGERQRATGAFRRGETDVLVGTIVLEVGVDVPGATLMVVVGCDRYGLATLHQLRGRVGRGGRRGLCVVTGPATARTAALVRTTDGFALAEEDLRLRGSGELLGRRQSGEGDLRALDVIEDHALLAAARAAVRREEDP